MTAAYIVLIRGLAPTVGTPADVIGPFPDGRAMDEWLSEHDETVDDWLTFRRDFGLRPHVALVEELSATRPAAWLSEAKRSVMYE